MNYPSEEKIRVMPPGKSRDALFDFNRLLKFENARLSDDDRAVVAIAKGGMQIVIQFLLCNTACCPACHLPPYQTQEFVGCSHAPLGPRKMAAL